MNEILTKNLAIFYGGQPVALATEFSMSVNQETIDINTIASSNFDQKIAGKKSFSFSFGALVASTTPAGSVGFNALLDAMLLADSPAVEIYITRPLVGGIAVTGDVYYRGNAIITSLEFSPSMNDKVTYSATMEGTGVLLKEVVD